MTTRNYADWLKAYLKYAEATEAPQHMHFWSGVSAVAGALRRKVWIDQAYFKWYPNFYIVLVAPPGIVSKSTTVGIAMDLLRKVPGIHFGPDVVTWQSLVERFASITEAFEYQSEYHPMSAMTLESSEFGNLLDPQDKGMIDLMVALWDGKQGGFEKSTKSSGNDVVENPWINLIACTTPSWINGNFPEYMIGGGFTSRTIFVYADQKAKFIAYPGLEVAKDLKEQQEKLVADLTQISALTGEYKLTDRAVEWGREWYKHHYSHRPANLDMDHFGGYIARKQVQMHKLAMVLAASSSDELLITEENLQVADYMITDLEPDLRFVFQRIGQPETTAHIEKFVEFVHAAGEAGVEYAAAYQHVHALFPSLREFEDMVAGCIKAGYISITQRNGGAIVRAGKAAVPKSSARDETGRRRHGVLLS